MFYVYAYSFEMNNKFFWEDFGSRTSSLHILSLKIKLHLPIILGRVILTRISLWCHCYRTSSQNETQSSRWPNMDFLAAGVYDDLQQVWCDSSNCAVVTRELYVVSCTVTLDINSFTESYAGTEGMPSQPRGGITLPVRT